MASAFVHQGCEDDSLDDTSERATWQSTVCRWGILGAANIARKNWKAIRLAENATLTAVASREPSRAKQWLDANQSECPFPTSPAACSYDDLLKRADVDAVYIPLPTGIRREWVVKAANAGKHVLCEKPCGPDANELRAMLDACKAKNVQFMDGVMFMHGKRLPLLRSALDDGETVGQLRRIASHFSFAAGEDFLKGNIRVSKRPRTARRAGRPRLVQHPLLAVRDEVRDADEGERPAAHRTRFRQDRRAAGVLAARLFWPNGVSRVVLLLVQHRACSSGHTSAARRGASASATSCCRTSGASRNSSRTGRCST